MNNIHLHLLNATGRSEGKDDLISGLVKQATERVVDKLPLKNVDILLFDPRDEQSTVLASAGEMRMGGMCYGPSMVCIPVNGLKIMNDEEKTQFQATLVHELFHASRWQNVGNFSDLKESLVNEGAAGHFENEILGVVRKRYYYSISGNEMERLKGRARLEYGLNNVVYHKWFLGRDSSIPLWAGYTIGYELVEKYLDNHSDLLPSNLLRKRASEIIGG